MKESEIVIRNLEVRYIDLAKIWAMKENVLSIFETLTAA